jgi:hypothetical protein
MENADRDVWVQRTDVSKYDAENVPITKFNKDTLITGSYKKNGIIIGRRENKLQKIAGCLVEKFFAFLNQESG